MRFFRISFLLCFFCVPLTKAQVLCKNLPSSFSSYSNVKQLISHTDFLIKDKVSTSKSSWIKAASFNSCDGKVGFLIVQVHNENYVHQDVPIWLWKSFKASSSFGSFYNQNLRNKYKLKLR